MGTCSDAACLPPAQARPCARWKRRCRSRPRSQSRWAQRPRAATSLANGSMPAGSGVTPVRPAPATVERPATERSTCSASSSAQPARLGHERRQLVRVEHVGSRRRRTRRRRRPSAAVDRVDAGRQAGLADEDLLRRVEIPRADEHRVLDADGAGVEHHPQRHAPLVAARRGLGRVEITVRVEPDEREPVEARRQGPRWRRRASSSSRRARAVAREAPPPSRAPARRGSAPR